MFKLVQTKEKDREHEYTFADGNEVIFNIYQGIPVELVYFGYIESLAEHVEITDYVEKYKPDLHRKYLSELKDHIESWGTEEDEREFQAGKERNWA